MNMPSTFNLSGYALGFTSGLVLTWAPFLAIWEGDTQSLVAAAIFSAIAAHTAGALGSR